MYTTFDSIPDHARVWVYQANRPLNESEIEQTLQHGQQFIAQWAAHGQALRASVDVRYHHFLIIALDEQYHAASGCSIDSSVGFVRALETAFGDNKPLNFFDRTQIAFLESGTVRLLPLIEVKAQLSEGQIAPEAQLFNNVVATKADLESRWLVSVQDSWLARYLPKVEIGQ